MTSDPEAFPPSEAGPSPEAVDPPQAPSDAAPRRRRRGGQRRPRVRHHVNPLAFVREQPLPALEGLFARPDQPLEVDIGCMHGEFILELAERDPRRNFLGLEIRGPLVDEVQARIARRGLGNAAALLCNANDSFEQLFAPASLAAVYVHFPDPWFKNRHRKRRLVTPELLRAIASRLAPGGVFRFLTDVEPYARQVLRLLAAQPDFENAHGAPDAPEVPDPARALTNREAWHLARGDAVHRYAWRKRA